MAKRNELGSLRRSQLVGVHGPGAIVDFRTDDAPVSIVTAGLDEWDENSRQPGLSHGQVIYEPRLQNELGVEGFRLPPVAPDAGSKNPAKHAELLVGVRFPTWLQCPLCHTLQKAQRWPQQPGSPAKHCLQCTASKGSPVYVVPARFVVTCEAGHLDDFPWQQWLAHKVDCKNPSAFDLRSTGSAGLTGLHLTCKACEATRSMEGCFSAEKLREVGYAHCRGRRPWLGDRERNCTEFVSVAQRGASNLYFPVIESALDIPPWTNSIARKLEQHWHVLAGFTAELRKAYLSQTGIAARLRLTPDEVNAQIEALLEQRRGTGEERLRWDEYCQFQTRERPFGTSKEFDVRPQDVPVELRRWIESVAVVARLREVRALLGFTRVAPPLTRRTAKIAPLSREPKSWLPAVENRGEGIFLSLSRKMLSEWEPRVADRASVLNRRYAQAVLRRTGQPAEREISARMLLVHSLSHLLIRQLSLTTGYASASLRERLYVGNGTYDMAGILIFTASPDADGTMGGLSRQGQTNEIAGILAGALRGAAWCSSDPLCIDGRASLSHELNHAACHACMLTAETSCEEFNYFLDRACLVGTPSEPDLGFFREYVSDSTTEGL